MIFPGSFHAQNARKQEHPTKSSEAQVRKTAEPDPAEAQRRSFAISVVTSLGEEANKYQDDTLRARVLSRVADTIWNSDRDLARLMFRRAWEAAEKVDDERSVSQDELPAMAIALRRGSGRDLRAEVLTLAARHDRALANEFLAKLAEQTKRELDETKPGSQIEVGNDGWSGSESSIKRLLIARRLVEQGEIERAVEFAGPALDAVNANSIGFLAALRVRSATVADQRFAILLSRSELDPLADANTVSGLSSYVFTPGLYVTFSADGGLRWSSLEEGDSPLSPPVLSPALVDKYFRTAGTILLRPLPPPERDFTSAGRTGKSMILRRLLPLFEQYSPQMAVALRIQLAELLNDVPKNPLGDDHHLLTQGLRFETAHELLETMQQQLDRAKTSRERDSIYADAAVALADRGDRRAQEVADKLDDPTRQLNVRCYVVLRLIKRAIKKREAMEVLRLAKADQLSHTHRAWAYTEAAKLVNDSDPPYSLRILEDAANEARRIDSNNPDRPRSLFAVATQLMTNDRVRGWEVMGEATKAANSATDFNGEMTELRFDLMTKSGIKIVSFGGPYYALSGAFPVFARDDFDRSLNLAKSLIKDAPRATATLAIARVIMVK